MEIVSIPLKGELEHKDTTGRNEIIKTNDVQIMSAGSGLAHSEYNASKTDPVNFLQIWVFPKVRDIKPLYNQKTFNAADRKDKFQVVVAPEENSNAVFINQDAWFSLGNLTAGTTLDYAVKKNGNGVYVFVLEGDVSIGNQQLNKRDGFGVWETDKISFKAESNTEVLLIEVPMS